MCWSGAQQLQPFAGVGAQIHTGVRANIVARGVLIPAGTIHADVCSNNHKIEVVLMKSFIVAFLKDEEGLTMVEYAVAGSLIAATLVTAFTDLGAAIEAKIRVLITEVNT